MTVPRRVLMIGAGVFLLTVGVRVGLMVGQETYRISPQRDYWAAGWETGRIAQHLAQGHGFSMELDQLGPKPATPTAWLAPLYPYVYSLVFRLAGVHTVASFAIIQAVQIALAGWTAVLLLILGRELFSERVALLAALIYSLWIPGAVFCVRFIWGTTLLAGLGLWLMLLVVRQVRQPRLGRAVWMGVVAGAILLTEPAAGVFVGVALLWISLGRGRQGLRFGVTSLVTTGLLVLPWIVRNHQVLGVWVPIKSNLGHELFIGNHPTATGFYRPARVTVGKWLDPADYARLAAADEVEMSQALGEYALRCMSDDPARFVGLTAKRIWWFWRLKFDSQWEKLIENKAVWKTLRWTDEVGQDALLILAYLGAVLGLWRRAGVGLVVMFLLTYPLAYYITHVDIPRYRYPVWPMVILLASWTLVEGRRALTLGERTRPIGNSERGTRNSERGH